jgi:hypothetical protein
MSEHAKTSSHADERRAIRVWFWTTVGLGTLPPIIGISGLALSHWARFGDAGELSGLLNFSLILLFVAALTVWPFWVVGLVAKRKLVQAYESEKPGRLYKTKYALIGAAAGTFVPYSMFFLYMITLPTNTSYGPFDWTGLWQAFAAYVMLILPVFALVSGFIGYWLGIAVAALLPEP